MRGKVHAQHGHAFADGITPAHAGKRCGAFHNAITSKDHPRACGEKQAFGSPVSGVLGSPPRMRGKAAVRAVQRDLLRITPAHAGKSVLVAVWAVEHGDHPRACGEKPRGPAWPSRGRGSPPRMRGKALLLVRSLVVMGITPAHAGKSEGHRLCQLVSKDHPRACGEKDAIAWALGGKRGSPPRMRGKVELLSKRLRNSGITPAHAGKSVGMRFGEGGHWDHPRACGEKKIENADFPGYRGSPPRMRGKAVKNLRSANNVRITPAHAGKSTREAKSAVSDWDHPRACGEKKWGPRQRRRTPGSPPRMRGKAPCRATTPAWGGITPAHAGKRVLG